MEVFKETGSLLLVALCEFAPCSPTCAQFPWQAQKSCLLQCKVCCFLLSEVGHMNWLVTLKKTTILLYMLDSPEHILSHLHLVEMVTALSFMEFKKCLDRAFSHMVWFLGILCRGWALDSVILTWLFQLGMFDSQVGHEHPAEWGTAHSAVSHCQSKNVEEADFWIQ